RVVRSVRAATCSRPFLVSFGAGMSSALSPPGATAFFGTNHFICCGGGGGGCSCLPPPPRAPPPPRLPPAEPPPPPTPNPPPPAPPAHPNPASADAESAHPAKVAHRRCGHAGVVEVGVDRQLAQALQLLHHRQAVVRHARLVQPQRLQIGQLLQRLQVRVADV